MTKHPIGSTLLKTPDELTVRTDVAYVVKDRAGREVAIISIYEESAHSPIVIEVEAVSKRDAVGNIRAILDGFALDVARI